ncbi:exonuclease RecJ [Haloarchaeobius sp. HME9146]|uniref:exonuclease RecJ n=1 Tax=Haloarchaeobius sp. HME9146 TaxID=2978732 RepID=UPI0021C175E9|nr:exonuclease RecJ [Haloarchaeobius sp. HME9146]MCT9096389.1 exonuclease RecJ [Haloarchaeobius sp. HME9146]
MSHSSRTADGPADAASDIAGALERASFVHVVARADGDAVAAAGLVARALGDVGTPFQVSVGRTVDARTERVVRNERDPETTALVVGSSESEAYHLDPDDEPASVAAWRLAGELGGAPDSVLALAGAVAAGVTPGAGATERLVDAAETSGRLVRRPGLAIPTEDVADGLAASTLVHAPFSGERAVADELVADLDLDTPDETQGDAETQLDDDARRTLASLVAVETVGADDATTRAGDVLERALRPYTTPDGRFATVGGLADVLDCAAVGAPGTGVALALGHDVREGALDAWRETAHEAHEAVREATTHRYDGVFVARVDEAPVQVAARLVRDFRSPEPVALVVGDDEAAAAAVDDRDLAGVAARTVTQTGGSADGTPRTAYATFECETKQFITAFREAL